MTKAHDPGVLRALRERARLDIALMMATIRRLEAANEPVTRAAVVRASGVPLSAAVKFYHAARERALRRRSGTS